MKTVLITGAFGGMGRATAKLLSESGYRVIALDKNVPEGDWDFISVKADITSEQSVRAAYLSVSAVTDEIYAIIHFAGIYALDSLVEISDSDFQKIFNINLRGAYLINKTFLPLLKENSRVLITTSELAPLDPLPFTGIYAVTKAALDKYAYSLAMELQLLGISVSVLRSGAVSTDMLGVSVTALDRFCDKTELYTCNADRFRRIVNKVEARSVAAEKIAALARRVIEKKRPAFAYSINRNPLLRLLSLLPKRLQLKIIKIILK